MGLESLGLKRGLALQSCVLVIGKKEEAEAEAEQNLEIVFQLLLDTKRWGGVV